MKSSEILRKAATIIKLDREEFVCFAIRTVGKENNCKGKALELREHIDASLGTYATVSSWLRKNSEDYCKFSDEADTASFYEEIRAYRLRWIEWMAQGYEAIGD